MEKSKLIDLLKTFPAKELREFGEFVASPFFNKNEELTRFYEYLRSQAPAFPDKKLERTYVFKQLYPKHAYDEKQLNYLMSFLLKLAEQYIGYSHFKADEVLEKEHTLASYDERGLEKHYQFILNQVERGLEQHPLRNTEFYLQQYLLADISNKHFLKQKVRKYDDRLQIASDNLDQFYLARKLYYCCEMLDRKKSIAAEYEIKFVDEVKRYVELSTDVHTPAVSVYYTVLRMLEDEAATDFEDLKQLIAEHSNKFTLADLQEIYSYALNFCIRKVNKGDQQYLEELLQLYQSALKDNILMEDDYLSPWSYKNIVGVGLRLRNFEWTEHFIREYNNRLAPEFRDNALHYNLAELNYYRREFGKALEYLNQVEFSDVYYSLDSKKMMLKIYYELEEVDALFSLISSFKMYIKRSKLVSAHNREGYQNFVHLLGQLVKRDPKTYADIERQLNDTAILGDRKWLLEAFEKLKKQVYA